MRPIGYYPGSGTGSSLAACPTELPSSLLESVRRARKTTGCQTTRQESDCPEFFILRTLSLRQKSGGRRRPVDGRLKFFVCFGVAGSPSSLLLPGHWKMHAVISLSQVPGRHSSHNHTSKKCCLTIIQNRRSVRLHFALSARTSVTRANRAIEICAAPD